MKLRVPTPPIEYKKEIVKFCEDKNILIKQLEKEI